MHRVAQADREANGMHISCSGPLCEQAVNCRMVLGLRVRLGCNDLHYFVLQCVLRCQWHAGHDLAEGAW